jgi:CheY-like chemotaxis protein
MGPSVFIIDGDEDFTAVAQHALEAQGWQVVIRDDGSIDQVRRVRPAVIVLSIELKAGSGFSICSRLRRDKELKTTPILLISGEQSSGNAFRKHAETVDHADDYALKPIEADELVTRVGALIAEAKKRGLPDSPPPAPPVQASENAGVPPPARSMGAPPALPSAGAAKDEPPPRPRGKAQAASGTRNEPLPGEAATGSAGGPSAAPPLPTATASGAGAPGAPGPSAGDGRLLSFDDALRERLEGAAPVSPSNPSPDQRLEFLRQRAKYLENREKAAREAWDQLLGYAKEADRRGAGVRLDLQKRETRISELGAEVDRTKTRLVSVETEFSTFQGEITRIFQEKDAEEKDVTRRLQALEESNSALEKDLADAQQRISDDSHRLTIFQDEVEDLQKACEEHEVRHSAATLKQAELERTIAGEGETIAELRARLDTTETVATERAQEVEKLLEKLDNVAIEATLERQRVADAGESAKAELAERHDKERAGFEEQLSAAAGQRLELEQKLETSEAELKSLGAAVTALTSQLEELGADKARIEKELDSTREAFGDKRIEYEKVLEEHKEKIVDLEAESAAQTAHIEEIEGNLDHLHADLAAQRAEQQRTLEAHRRTAEILEGETATQSERIDELEAEKEQLGADLHAEQEARTKLEATSRETITNLEVELAAKADRIGDLETAKDSLTAERQRLTEVRDQEQERARALELELDDARTQLFDRLADLDQLRTEQGETVERAQSGAARVATLEEQLSAAETVRELLETERASLKDDLEGFTKRLVEAEAEKETLEAAEREASLALEGERDRADRAESFIKKAKEKIVELQRQVEETAAERRARGDEAAVERTARVELEARIGELESELSMREMEAAEAGRRAAELEAETSQLGAALKDAQGQAEAVRRDGHAQAEAARRDAQAHSDSAKREAGVVKNLRAELAERDERIAAIEAEQFERIAALEAERDERDARIAAIEAEHIERVAAIEAERDERVAALEAERDERVAALEAEQFERVAALEAERDERVAALEAEQFERVAAVEAERDERVAALEAEHIERVATLETERAEHELRLGVASSDAERLHRLVPELGRVLFGTFRQLSAGAASRPPSSELEPTVDQRIPALRGSLPPLQPAPRTLPPPAGRRSEAPPLEAAPFGALVEETRASEAAPPPARGKSPAPAKAGKARRPGKPIKARDSMQAEPPPPAKGDLGLAGVALEDHPFGHGSGLPPPQPDQVGEEPEFSDRNVTEIIRLKS